MGRIRDARPSPAIVVVALALLAALAGTAVAGPSATTSAISKKKVKKIATKQINKLAPGLSVASADTAANAGALGGKAPGAYASSVSEPYREVNTPGQPQFQNGWANRGGSDSTAAFYRDPLGVVHLKGTFETGNDNTVAFTLPPGYRASRTLNMPAFPGTGNPTQLTIPPNGNVSADCIGSASCIVGIDGLTFRAG